MRATGVSVKNPTGLFVVVCARNGALPQGSGAKPTMIMAFPSYSDHAWFEKLVETIRGRNWLGVLKNGRVNVF